MAAVHHLGFLKFGIFTVDRLKMAKIHHLANFMKLGETNSELWRFNDFSRWRPSAILDVLCTFGRAHDKYLVVFSNVQNLTGIGAVVSIICKC